MYHVAAFEIRKQLARKLREAVKDAAKRKQVCESRPKSKSK